MVLWEEIRLGLQRMSADLKMHFSPASGSLINMLTTASPRIEPWGTWLATGCQPDVTPFTATL